MKRTILLYGISLAALVIALRLVEYRFLIHDLSMELYIGTIAIFFAVLGVWAGRRLTRKKTILVNADFVFDEPAAKRLGISPRELEVLQLMSGGLSNQEIADKLFVSLNTIKTHTSNLFLKLDVKRRTQAIQKAKELRFIP
jgi:DNA-binding NarL/FixJ family response regulator